MYILLLLLTPCFFSYESDTSIDNNEIKSIQNGITRLITDILKNPITTSLSEIQVLEEKVRNLFGLIIIENPELTTISSMRVKNEGMKRFNIKGEKDNEGFSYHIIADMYDAISAIQLHLNILSDSDYRFSLFDFSKIRSMADLLKALRKPEIFKKIPNKYKPNNGSNVLSRFPRYYFARKIFNELLKNSSNWTTSIHARLSSLLTMEISDNYEELLSIEEEIKKIINLIIRENPDYTAAPTQKDKNGEIPKFNIKGKRDDVKGFGYNSIIYLYESVSILKLHINILNSPEYGFPLVDFSKINTINLLHRERRSPGFIEKIPAEFLPIYSAIDLFKDLKNLGNNNSNNNWITSIKTQLTNLLTPEISANYEKLLSIEEEIKEIVSLIIQENSEYTAAPIERDENGEIPKFNIEGKRDDIKGFRYSSIAYLYEAVLSLKLHLNILNNPDYGFSLFNFLEINSLSLLHRKQRSHDIIKKIPTEFLPLYSARELFKELKNSKIMSIRTF